MRAEGAASTPGLHCFVPKSVTSLQKIGGVREREENIPDHLKSQQPPRPDPRG